MHERDNHNATVRWDARTRRLSLVWHGAAAGEGYREIMSAALDTLLSQRGRTWLSDRRQLGVLRAEDQQWLHDHWLPRAVAGGVHRIAVLTPPTALSRMGVRCRIAPSATAESTQTANGDVLEMSWFEELARANAWLDADAAAPRPAFAA